MKNKKDALMSSSLSYKTRIFSIKNEVLGGFREEILNEPGWETVAALEFQVFLKHHLEM